MDELEQPILPGDNVDAFKIGDRAYGVNTRCDAEEKRTHRLH